MKVDNLTKTQNILEELVEVLKKHGIVPNTSIGIHDSETGNSLDLNLSAVVCFEDYA